MANTSTDALQKLLHISRPRFWIYVFGPYLVGLLCGARDLQQLRGALPVCFGLFFLLPANLLIYGVNDIFDYETDKRNPKKSGYEILVSPAQHRVLWTIILWMCAPFLLLIFFANFLAAALLAGFLGFSIGYSAPPIRAKGRPLLDSVFNVLYAFPGWFAYCLMGGKNVEVAPILAAWFWTMAMHAYSAVPDISSDKSTDLPTIATWLGLRGTLYFCALLYALAAALSFSSLGFLAILLGAIYITMIAISLRANEENGVRKIYKLFPLVNTLCGAALFWFVALTKFVKIH